MSALIHFPGITLPLPPAADPRIAECRPLVRRLAFIFRRGWLAKYLTVDDLMAVGMETVWRATLDFKPKRGASFETFVTRCLINDFQQEHLRYRRRKRAAVTWSLHNEMGEMIDLESPWPGPERLVWMAQIHSLLDELEPQHREVIQRRIFEDDSLADVGKTLDLSRERIRQLEWEALRILERRIKRRRRAP